MPTQSQTTQVTMLRTKAVRLLGIVLLIGWGLGLTGYTLQLQHACPSLLSQNRFVPVSCSSEQSQKQKITQVSSNDRPKRQSPSAQLSLPVTAPTATMPEKTLQSKAPAPPTINISAKELAAIAAGSVTIVGLAIIGAPILVTAGAGAAVWYAARVIASSTL